MKEIRPVPELFPPPAPNRSVHSAKPIPMNSSPPTTEPKLSRASGLSSSRHVFAVLLAALTAAIPISAFAQTAPAPTAADKAGKVDDLVQLDKFVISGTVLPKRQMDSAAAITTIDAESIKISMPRGGPDLMKLVPGIYVESAGGEGRANVYTRGIPQAGGYTFAGLQEDGLGVLSETATRGVAPDMLTRLTGLVARVESVRGGTAGVFMNNAPGGIINFINREGTAVRQGEITLQTSDYNQRKVSIWTTGPLNADTSYAVSGDFRRDDGQRYQGFVANDGGSFAGNIKRTFADDRGSLKISAKWQDERNAFYLPIPLKNARDPQTIPGGIDIRHGHIYSADLRRSVSLASTPDGSRNPDLADGGHARMAYIGSDLELKLGDGLKLRNMNRYANVNWNSSILVLASVATPLQILANGIGTSAGTQFAAARSGSNYRYRISYPGTGAVVSDSATLNGNGLGLLQNMSTSQATIRNFQNDLRLMKATKGGVALSAGLFTSWINARALAWAYTMVTEVHNLPRRLDIEYLDATSGAPLGAGTYQGMRQASTAAGYRNNRTTHKDVAPYLNAEQAWGNWTFDGGLRHEKKKESISTAVLRSNYNLNADGQNNPALRNATYGSGAFYTMDYKVAATVWTGAANYKFSDRFSAYGRIVNAYRMSNTEDLLLQARARNPDPGPTNHIQQVESGVKYSTKKFSVFASVIGSQLTNQLFAGQIAQPDGSIVATNFYRDTDGVSVELEAFYTPVKPLTFHFVGTQQKVKFASEASVTGLDSTGKFIAISIKGKRPVRIPKTFFTSSAVYRLPELSWGRVSTNIDWEYVGQRVGDEGNRTSLAAYSQFALGVNLKSGRYSWRVQIQNLLDKIGFTEGDQRTALLIGDPNAAYLNARTIGPRSIVGSVSYAF